MSGWAGLFFAASDHHRAYQRAVEQHVILLRTLLSKYEPSAPHPLDGEAWDRWLNSQRSEIEP